MKYEAKLFCLFVILFVIREGFWFFFSSWAVIFTIMLIAGAAVAGYMADNDFELGDVPLFMGAICVMGLVVGGIFNLALLEC